ncbi:hypothetical protein GGF31_006010 [Allomyces arbusculus]|nr:hypothetical protein GGF31_006010 [Allomyces arbusculus]
MFSGTKDFMGKPAPAGYIAGLGRGATGFTTRSDIGPAREASAAALQKEAQATTGDDGGDEDRYNDDPENESGLFSSLPYDADDEEADAIYAAVDAALANRRKKWRDAKDKEQKTNTDDQPAKLTDMFVDAKIELRNVSVDDWEALPEAANLSRRKTKKDLGRERFVPVPDSVLTTAHHATQVDAAVPTGQADGTHTDFVEMGAARDRVLGVRLDQVSDSVAGQTVVDPKGYLTGLNSVLHKSDAEIGDIKKARLLLKSVITTNKNHAPGWIAAARLEEIAGKLVQARALIAKGCEECPKNEDIWLEAARLNTIDNAKVILAKAVRHIPTSVKIWLHASKLEGELASQKRVLRRALEFVPTSMTLWKAAISLEENPDDARILLTRAVECVPLAVDMWLTLAKLETYDRAKAVLNKARKTIPTAHEIWIAAAMLEESQGNAANVEIVIGRGIQALANKGTVLPREKWLDEAVECEQSGAVLTCQSIIKHTIGMGLEEEQFKKTWMEDAETCTEKKCYATARAIYEHAVAALPHKKSIWRRAAFFEREHGTREQLLHLLERAVAAVPRAELLWLMAAKEKWLAGDIHGARLTLAAAFQANPASPQIWLAAVKLEQENKDYDRARAFLARARDQAGGEPRVWMKSAVLERLLGDLDAAITLVQEGVMRFPTFAKLWLIWAQVEEARGNIAAARDVCAKALKSAPTSVALWVQSAQLEERAGWEAKARVILDNARMVKPKTPLLWYEAIALEKRCGNTSQARFLLATALQECPTAGLLWGEAILLEDRPQRRARILDAIKHCGESDLYVLLAVARVFWAERKSDKARSWFERAIKADDDYGDTWAYWLRFERMHGTAERQAEVVNKCVAAEPKHGEIWPRVAKAVENTGKSIEEILELVAAEVKTTV